MSTMTTYMPPAGGWLNEALRLRSCRLTVLPVKPDGSKRPALQTWQQLQHELIPTDQQRQLFEGKDVDGIGVACGAASGELEMLELEGRAVERGLEPQLDDAMRRFEVDDVWQMIKAGYVERSPSGGIHWHYRVADGHAMSNTRLARTVDLEPLIETRGQGGFTIFAPSGGRTHPSGGSWEVLHGDPASIATITSEQRDAIYDACTTLDEATRAVVYVSDHVSSDEQQDRPGDDYNARRSWHDVIGPHGWTVQRRIGDVTYWRKPGKHKLGCSATTGRDEHDRLYVFSTATEFEPEKPYSKFAAYTLLDHGGDFAAAARQLRSDGYGNPITKPLRVNGAHMSTSTTTIGAPSSNGTKPEETAAPFDFQLGGTFILDGPAEAAPVWGRDSDVLWAEGEALMIASDQGLGKTTLAQQLIMARCGFPAFASLLGFPVVVDERPVLYLAMDRPSQARRAFRRLVTDVDRRLLDQRLKFWAGPPPADLARKPEVLAQMCAAAGVGTVVIDSLKDAALDLSKDETGAAYNRARQLVLNDGVEVLELHHNRKQERGKLSAPTLADVYGSTWLTAGTGSVVLLTGKPGDPIVGLVHIKQPSSAVGPFKIVHDAVTGRSHIHQQSDLLGIMRARLAPMSRRDVAEALFETDRPTDSELMSTKRKLDGLLMAGQIEVVDDGDEATAKPKLYVVRTLL